MKIAVFGTGAMGSAFAYQLARAGHDVTTIARGARLEHLAQQQAIVLTTGERAQVSVVGNLDPAVAFDLVLVTVLATQVDAILPALKASSAKRVMFMFNTFKSIEPLRQAVGPERFAFGFPGGVFVILDKEGHIHPQVRRGTTTSDAMWATVFSNAGIPTSIETDMQSYLRSHAAMVYPLMAIGVLVLNRGAGITWPEARRYAEALVAGFGIVRAMGSQLHPGWMGRVVNMPRADIAAIMWSLSRTTMLKDLGKLGSTEARMLADMMAADRPEMAAPLTAVRP